MRLRREQRDAPEVNLTPLIDVVFLLLIFFMVSTTFSRDSELGIELPEATLPPEERDPEHVEVAIDAQGRFYIDGRQLLNTQLVTVKQALSEATAERTAPVVVVSADGQTPHQSVVTVMDAARQLGLLRLTFAARLSEEQERR
jgi:biopolymer transport protein ExbD